MITEFVEVTFVTTEFTDISPRYSTPISPILIHVITGSAEVLHEDFPDRLQPMRDIQHVIDLTPGASLPDLPHHRIDPTMHIELKARVDELSLNVKQQCIVPISIHFFKDKFWSYIVTKDVSQTKNVIIYVRPMSKHSMNSVMRESSIIHITNFPSLPVKQ